MAEMPDETLAKLVRALESQNLDYAIIGGVAVAIMSTPRATLDVDAVIWAPDRTLGSVLQDLQASGLTSRSSDPLAFAAKHRMILLRDENGVEVDISIGGLPFEEEAVRTAWPIEIEPGLVAKVASPETIVVMKAIASRPKDLEDIRQLLKMNPRLDRKRVQETVREFSELLEAPELSLQLEQLFAEIPYSDS